MSSGWVKSLRRGGALMAAIAAMCVIPTPAQAVAPYTIVGTFPGGIGGAPDMDSIDQMGGWQGKRNGIVNIFAGDPSTAYTLMVLIWDRYRAIPMVSYQPPGTNLYRASGAGDGDALALASAFHRYVVGPDGIFESPDDRRAYLRYGYEVNHESHPYSPCSGFEAAIVDSNGQFAEGWRRAHRIFHSVGLHRYHVAWIFSVAAFDTCSAGAPEKTYPGNAYADWVGVDVFGCTGTSAANLLDGMINRLRNKAPGKPVGVNEAGVTSRLGTAAKNAWISAYWDYLYAKDIRMSSWINWDTEDGNTNCADGTDTWAVFGQNYGDESFTSGGRTFRAFSAYRQGVGRSFVITTNTSNPRYLTNSQFIGQ